MKIGLVIGAMRKRMIDYHSGFMWLFWLTVIAIVAVFLINRQMQWVVQGSQTGIVVDQKLRDLNILNLLHEDGIGPHIDVKLENDDIVCVVIENKKNARFLIPGSRISFSVLKNKETGKTEYRLSDYQPITQSD